MYPGCIILNSEFALLTSVSVPPAVYISDMKPYTPSLFLGNVFHFMPNNEISNMSAKAGTSLILVLKVL